MRGGKVFWTWLRAMVWLALTAAVARAEGPFITLAQYLIDATPDATAAWHDVAVPADCAYDEAREEFYLPAIDVSSLTPGEHVLFFRLQDSNGRWGVPRQAWFRVPADAPDAAPDVAAPADRCQNGWIVAAEYYIDTDPGEGKGLPLPVSRDPGNPLRASIDATITIDDPALLLPGRHTVFVRFRDAAGRWGLARPLTPSDPFLGNGGTFDSPREHGLAAAEYFIDIDPGEGKGTPLRLTPGTASIDAVITIDDPALLSPGEHTIHVRFRDTAGRWGPPQLVAFDTERGAAAPKSSGPAGAVLAEGQYCITRDDTASSCQWVPLPVADGAFDEAQESVSQDDFPLDITGLGYGTFSFYVRFRDNDGDWSIPRRTTIQVPRPATIQAAEYLVARFSLDAYPPSPPDSFRVPFTPGRGTALPPLDGAYDTATEEGGMESLTLDVSQLDPAASWGLYVGFQDDEGRWSGYKAFLLWGDLHCGDPDTPAVAAFCEPDCAGVPGGVAYQDNCGECVGGTTGKKPCEQDCNGVWGGVAYLDNCGECVGGASGKKPCEQDCNGVWGGVAYLDNCGECVGGTTGKTPCAMTSCTDKDKDGYAVESGECGPVDCDDNDAGGRIARLGHLDRDGDGYGTGEATAFCTRDGTLPAGYATVGGDCRDSDGRVHPYAAERCDGVDNDCDGTVDEGCVSLGTDGRAPVMSDEGEVVWIRWHEPSGRFQIFSSSRGWLTEDPTDKISVTVNDLGWLAWIDRQGDTWRLRCSLGGQTLTITEGTIPLGRPALNNAGVLVFSRQEAEGGRILQVTVSEPTTWARPKVLSALDADASAPFINERGDVVWLQHDAACGCTSIWGILQGNDRDTAERLVVPAGRAAWPCITDFGEIIWLGEDDQGRPAVLSSSRGTLQSLADTVRAGELTVNGRGDFAWVEESGTSHVRLRTGDPGTYFFVDVDDSVSSGLRYRIMAKNFNEVAASLTIVLRHPDGRIAQVVHRRIPAHEAAEFHPAALAGRSEFTGIVSIWSTAPLACMGIQEDGDHTLVSATTASRQATTHIFPSIKDTRWGTGNKETLFVFNPGDRPVEVTMELHDFDGTLLRQVSQRLAAGARLRTRLVDLFGGDTITGWVRLHSPELPVAAAMVFAPNSTSRTAYVAPEPATYLVVPKVKATASMSNFLALVNPNDQPAAVTVILHTWRNGASPSYKRQLVLKPGEKQTVTVLPVGNSRTEAIMPVPATADTVIAGYLVITADWPVAASHTVRMNEPSGAAKAVSTVLPVTGNQRLAFPVVDNVRYDNTIAVLNPDTNPVHARILITDASGRPLHDQEWLLDTGDHAFFRLADVVGRENFTGDVVLTADWPVVGHLTVYNEAAYEILPALGPAYGNVADSDRDGIGDAVERLHPCLDPFRWDTDGDLIGDGWEDANHNGWLDPGETDPCTPDRGQGISLATVMRLLRYLAGYPVPSLAGLDINGDGGVNGADAVLLLHRVAGE